MPQRETPSSRWLSATKRRFPRVEERGVATVAIPSLLRRAVLEGIGTAFLLSAVVGSGVMAERLSGGNAGLALLANSLATGAALVALVLSLASTSGAHFNPVVTVTDVILRGRQWREVPAYVVAQFCGAFGGVALANAMFGEPLFAFSRRARTGLPEMLGEFVATFGLLAVIFIPVRRSAATVAVAVGSYITAAYWFTSSTSFANPAVTLARAVTDTFTGIRAADVPGFIVGQILGTVAFVSLARWVNAPAGTGSRADEEQ
jgi:glycerol uptake facilitator-like aquaporin